MPNLKRKDNRITSLIVVQKSNRKERFSFFERSCDFIFLFEILCVIKEPTTYFNQVKGVRRSFVPKEKLDLIQLKKK